MSFANFSNAGGSGSRTEGGPGTSWGGGVGQQELSFILKGQGGLDGVPMLGRNSRPSVKTQRDASQRLQGPNPLPTGEDGTVAPSPTTDFQVIPN